MIPNKSYVPRTGYLSMNPYDLHKHLINTYVLDKKGSTQLFTRDTSRDKTDADVLRENHKFLWEDDEEPTTWEETLAKKYYDKLYKEFCITDLTLHKENKFAMRWQTEKELVSGKGQFVCGSKTCAVAENLRTWEVNFAYKEHGERKNALVKLRLCPDCSIKLNHKNRRKEIKRNKKSQKSRKEKSEKEEELSEEVEEAGIPTEPETSEGSDIWTKPLEDVEEPSRDEEFEKYLEHLLL